MPKSSQGAIIQPMSLTQYMVSPACTSAACIMSCAALIGKPQWLCTAPLGRPVVPEV